MLAVKWGILLDCNYHSTVLMNRVCKTIQQLNCGVRGICQVIIPLIIGIPSWATLMSQATAGGGDLVSMLTLLQQRQATSLRVKDEGGGDSLCDTPLRGVTMNSILAAIHASKVMACVQRR